MDSIDDSRVATAAAPAALPAGDDLSAIAWVQEELRRSLDAAHKSLRRFLKDSEAVTGSDIDSVDPGVLRTARSQIHQGVGALELVGLPAAAIVLRASETAVQRSISRPQSLTPELVADIEHASFGLLDFLGRVLAGKQVSPLSLFPQYRAVQEQVEAERMHPADLWSMDWRWREIAGDPEVVPRRADDTARSEIEGSLLSLMRGTQTLTAASRMSDIAAGLAAGSEHPQVRTFWNLAAAMFEAQHHGLVGFDVFTKRVASRLLAQFRILQRGDSDVSERLARDVLFFCSQAGVAGRLKVPRLAAVREAYGLVEQPPVDYSLSVLGRFDPAIVTHAKKRVVAAKEAWSASAGGEMHRLAGLSEQFALVGDSLRKLFPFGETFAAELQAAAVQTQQAQVAPPAPLAMEVATSLLYLEAALDDGDFDQPEHADRVRRLGERLAKVRAGQPPEPLEPWMEELYRRVSERQTMGSVVQELRASLSEVEKAIDQFFRDPKDQAGLVDVPTKLASMRGVLSVLGMDPASQALLRMKGEIEGMVSTGIDVEQVRATGLFDRLAGNLSALGFLIDMLSVQPQMAKSLFVFDADAGTLAPVMGRSASPAPPGGSPVEPRLIEQAQMLAFRSVRDDVPLLEVSRDLERLSHEAQAADQPALAAAVLKAQEALGKAGDELSLQSARGELSEALVDFVATATEPTGGLSAVSEPVPLAPLRPIALVGDLEHDDEMRDVFLEEAHEVIAAAQGACAELQSAPGDLGLLTTLRRAFHTLKGSSRMVGLKAFGEAAWACEQVFNTQLAEQRPAEPSLIEFASWVLGHLSGWVDAIAAHADEGRTEGEVKVAADRLARRMQTDAAATTDIDLPMAAPAPQTVPATFAFAGLPPDLPNRADLEFGPPPVGEVTSSSEDLSFEFDLSGFEAPMDLGTINPQVLAAASLGVDASPMFDPFDVPADEAMQTTLVNEEFRPETHFGTLDLDLGNLADAVPMIQSLSPSTGARADAALPAGPDSESGLLFDLATGDASPAGSAATAHGEVDFEVETSHPAELSSAADDHVKIVGPLRIGIPLFNIYLNEADELSRRLVTEVSEWAMELHRPIGEVPVALAHSLAGSSATVGFTDLSHLARSLEHALARSQVIGHGTDDEAQLFAHAAEEIRRLLHQFAAGFLKEPAPELLRRLAEHERSSAMRLEAATTAAELAEGQDSESPPEADAVESLISLQGLESAAALPVAEQPPQAVSTEVSGSEAVGSHEAVPTPALPVFAEEDAAATQPALLDEAAPALGAAAPQPVDVPAETVRVTLAAEPPIEPVAWVAPGAESDEEPDPAFPHGADDAGPPASTFGALSPVGSLGVAALKPLAAAPVERVRPAGLRAQSFGNDDDIDAVDAVDLELFPIFEEEALELLPKFDGQLRDWARQPADAAHAAACMRTLHTLKGGARLAGAMRLGEMAHRLETRIERLTAADASASAGDVETLQARADSMTQAFDALRNRDAQAYADAVAASSAPLVAAAPPPAPAESAVVTPAPVEQAAAKPAPAVQVHHESELHVKEKADPAPAPTVAALLRAPEEPTAADVPNEPATHSTPAAGRRGGRPSLVPPKEVVPIDWSRFTRVERATARPADRNQAANQSSVRVRAPLLDRLVNQAGEVSITRSRIESGVSQIKGSLGDLTENLERLRGQLRDIELQGEVQMTSRLEAAKAASQAFDPLEFDRFTRFQELTRMMAESVNDVATVQRTLQRSLESTEDELVAQARLTRDLQDDLLRTRMVEFEGLSDRLYRVVRMAAKETGKQVRLDIVGGSIEVDRGVLDRMTGAFEHLLRNCVSHGIESPETRTAAGKDAVGTIVVALSQEGNEVGVEFRDDGAGLDMAKIRAKAEAMKLIDPTTPHEDAELANLIFTAGFSTADTVTELAGRGVGMDVVRSDVIAMGGRIETATAAGEGTSFKMILPLTTAVTQVVMLRCGESTVAVPSTLVEIVRRARPEEVDAAYASGTFEYGENAVPFFWLGALLQLGAQPGGATGRTRTVVVVRSAQQRIAVHVDEVLGNQEVVVKNLGPQLSRLPGLAGMTLLTSGAVALIYNPVALATLYGESARTATQVARGVAVAGSAPVVPEAREPAPRIAPLVLVVDDSLTVRRVTQRLLVREGYRVTLAKDGLDALERLAEEKPQIVLSDIEMPRMDGFDLVRNIRADARLRGLPVIMITSRIAQKHREHAAELGVDHYLGKPYSEEDLLALIGRYTGVDKTLV